MAWERFIVNNFIHNCVDVQDKGKDSHYKWIIILVAMITWLPPPERDFTPIVESSFHALCFRTLQYTKDKKNQMEINTTFHLLLYDMIHGAKLLPSVA